MTGGKIYLLGGWDGHIDMADFWEFDIKTSQWNCTSVDTSKEGGPTARSCHKICIDSSNRKIYLLVMPCAALWGNIVLIYAFIQGGYIDPDLRSQVTLTCDFFVYHIDLRTWECISHDVHADGGPELIYDHQMCMDSARQVIYVFGGRSINTRSLNSSEDEYSGLYAFDVRRKTWRLIRNDDGQPNYSIKLKSRIGHSMLLNPNEQALYIFAGQRNKEYLNDFFVYDIGACSIFHFYLFTYLKLCDLQKTTTSSKRLATLAGMVVRSLGSPSAQLSIWIETRSMSCLV